jgi:hypothetical protein
MWVTFIVVKKTSQSEPHPKCENYPNLVTLLSVGDEKLPTKSATIFIPKINDLDQASVE